MSVFENLFIEKLEDFRISGPGLKYQILVFHCRDAEWLPVVEVRLGEAEDWSGLFLQTLTESSGRTSSIERVEKTFQTVDAFMGFMGTREVLAKYSALHFESFVTRLRQVKVINRMD